MLRPVASGNNIYLSPHHDDVAFSLGALVAGAPGGLLVNLFTRSGYVEGTPVDQRPDVAAVERVTALRRAEDLAFAAQYRLDRLDLGLDEPPVRGRSPWDLEGLADDIEQLRVPLTALLERVADGTQIFCPAGIGGHVNHLAVRAVVIGMLAELARRAEVLFYEDLPYAASSRSRRRGIADLRAALGGGKLRRGAWAAGAEKLVAVNLYASQQAAPRGSLQRFSPRTIWPFGPHEAVWGVITAS
jgi:hypothetical protein